MAKKGLGETAPEGRNMRYIQRPYPTPKARAREHIAGHGTKSPLIKQALMHKYSIGQLVYFEGAMQYDAARGQYKIVRLVPISATIGSFIGSRTRRKYSSAPPRNIS